MELVLFCFLEQVDFSFRLAFRRSSYYCDENTVRSKSMIGGGSWQAVSSGYYTRTIANARFQCTDYSVREDWSSGENSFTYSFSHAGPWLVRLVQYRIKNYGLSMTLLSSSDFHQTHMWTDSFNWKALSFIQQLNVSAGIEGFHKLKWEVGTFRMYYL